MTEKKVIETKYGWYQKNDDKVNVDEIIGIVKTDEQTNSVQLKKEAQLTICEKRVLELEKENEQLKTDNGAFIQDIEVFKEENTHLKLENEQLQVRNDRQAKQLDRLYQLISQKDWRTLSDIMDDFKRCEEQLQRESGTYW